MGLEGLAPFDGWAVASILTKLLDYVASLLAVGGGIFLAVFAKEGASLAGWLRRLTAFAAVAGLLLLLSRIAIRAARISGLGPEGMFDPTMLSIVWNSPLGSSTSLRAAGFILVLAVFWRSLFGTALSLLGAALVAVSFCLIGHSLDDPRKLVASLLVVHFLAASYWVGALMPLRNAAKAGPSSAKLLRRFGIIAMGVIGILLAAGVALAYLLVGSLQGLMATAYGWTLVGKVALVVGLLSLAALNKLRLVPALESGSTQATMALRRSIACEIYLVVGILFVTATLTTITSPPAIQNGLGSL